MSSERKAQGKRRPMIDRHRRRMIAAFKCNDCGLNVIRAGEYYMVSPQIWDDWLHLEWNDNLCIGCLESRLGRKLTILDFIVVPHNPGGFSLSNSRSARGGTRTPARRDTPPGRYRSGSVKVLVPPEQPDQFALNAHAIGRQDAYLV